MQRAIIAGAAILLALMTSLWSQSTPPASSSTAKHSKSSTTKADLDAESLADGFYHNKAIGLTCKIPTGWVVRTDEINARSEAAESKSTSGASASSSGAKVLLAVFSRPPEARAEDVNASILIAVENQASYPGLKEAPQYFGPLSEVAKAQGFIMDEDPYAIAIGSKVLVRGDFHKDVGSRVMRQSTMAYLAQGYAVSITVIGGTDDEVQDLVDGLSFAGESKRK